MSTALAYELPPSIPPGAEELPYDDGEPMETYRHYLQMSVLRESLRYGWKDRHDFFVGGNMFLYFSELQVRKNDFRGPDVFVVLDTTDEERLSWVVWKEDGRTPDVVIELLSDSTASVDRGKKKEIYARQLKVRHYYLFDPMTKELEGFVLQNSSLTYAPMAPLANGDLPCSILGLTLGVREGEFSGVRTGWLRWIDADGNCLPTGEDLAGAAQAKVEAAQAEAEAAEAKVEAAEAKAEAAEAKAEAAEAKVEAAEAKAEAAEAKAEAAEAKAQSEAQRASDLAAKLAEYEKRFGPS